MEGIVFVEVIAAAVDGLPAGDGVAVEVGVLGHAVTGQPAAAVHIGVVPQPAQPGQEGKQRGGGCQDGDFQSFFHGTPPGKFGMGIF